MSVMLTMAVVVEVAVVVTQRTTRLHDRSMATALMLM